MMFMLFTSFIIFLFYLSCDLILLNLHFIISFGFFFFGSFQLSCSLNGVC
jgi:hypothetical protein